MYCRTLEGLEKQSTWVRNHPALELPKELLIVAATAPTGVPEQDCR